METNPVSQITSLQADQQQPTHNTIVLDHHIFTAGEWKRARLRAHPMIPIRISIDKSPRKPLAKMPNGTMPMQKSPQLPILGLSQTYGH